MVALADAAGTIQTAYTYEPYGARTASGSPSGNPAGFTGREHDATGLAFYRARYYDPVRGRFLSEDPAGFAAGDPNLYRYVGDDPVDLTDPSGMFIDTVLDAGFVGMDLWNLATGSRKDVGANLAALGLDVLGLAIPFVTGLGAASRLARGADEAVSLADTGLHYLDDLARAACSFSADTPVATPEGEVPISGIEVGDLVLAWDEASGTLVERKVTAVLPHPDDEIARLTLDDGEVTTTPDHPFLTLERGWVEAGRLWPGAHVKTADGVAMVESVAVERYQGTLWDLTVEGAHTFFVGSGEWLVHNCPLPRRVLRAGGAAPASQILSDAERWLGPNYIEIAPGVFRSADGARQFRMTDEGLDAVPPHVHFEAIGPDGRAILETSHVIIE